MVRVKAILKVVDNSGARFVECLRVLSKASKQPGKIGDLIVVSTKRVTPNKKIKKGTVQLGVIVRAATNLIRLDGSRLRFDQTVIVLLSKLTTS